MPIVSELREVIGALQGEVEFEAAVRELGAAGVDQARISFLAQEEIPASRAGAIGCDIKQLPRVEIGLSDDRQQVRTLATSLAVTVASFAGAGAVSTGKFVCDGNEIRGISTQARSMLSWRASAPVTRSRSTEGELVIEEVA
jgi:hypothetical protein